MRPIVFLHIPKTAGQTVHHELSRLVGAKNVSPVRVREQAVEGRQMPPGYLLHSGHIDWTELETVPDDPFTFTVLRTPTERIGSFYFFMHAQAFAMSEEEVAASGRPGLQKMRSCSADDYFFGGDRPWQWFIRNLYDNFYGAYLATGLMQGRRQLENVHRHEVLARAEAGAAQLTRIYRTDNLAALETDIQVLYGKPITLTEKFANEGNHARSEKRWPKLLDRFESDENRRRIEDFAAEDERLMERLRERMG